MKKDKVHLRKILFSVLSFSIGIGLIIFLFSCASIMHGTSQKIKVTSIPPGAKVIVKGSHMNTTLPIITPSVITLSRKENKITLRFKKDGYKPFEVTIKRNIDGLIFGNMMFGVIGLIFDFCNGAAYKLSPDLINAVLEDLKNQRINVDQMKKDVKNTDCFGKKGTFSEVLPGVTQVVHSREGDLLALREVDISDGKEKKRILIGGICVWKSGKFSALVGNNSFEFDIERWPGDKKTGDLHVIVIPDTTFSNFEKKVIDSLTDTLVYIMQEAFYVGIAKNEDEVRCAISKAEGEDVKVDKNLFLSIFDRKNRNVGRYLQFITGSGTEALFEIDGKFFEPGPNGGRSIELFDLEKGLRNQALTLDSLAGKISVAMKSILLHAKEKYGTGLRVMNYELYLIGNEIMVKFTFDIGKGRYVTENYSMKSANGARTQN